MFQTQLQVCKDWLAVILLMLRPEFPVGDNMNHLGDILWQYGHSSVEWYITVHPVISALLKLQDEKLEASLN